MDIVIQAKPRDMAVSASQVRAEGNVPAVCYGLKKENLHVAIEHAELLKAYRIAQKNTVLTLDLDGKKVEVLFYNLDYDYLTDRIMHVDFYLIDQKVVVNAEIPLNFEGTSLAVVNLSCVLNPLLDTLKVKCLPKDLPPAITVDISTLVSFDSVIRVKDLELGEGIEVITPADRQVCGVIAPRGARKGDNDEADSDAETSTQEAGAEAA